jgi:hypothetical protein
MEQNKDLINIAGQLIDIENQMMELSTEISGTDKDGMTYAEYKEQNISVLAVPAAVFVVVEIISIILLCNVSFSAISFLLVVVVMLFAFFYFFDIFVYFYCSKTAAIGIRKLREKNTALIAELAQSQEALKKQLNELVNEQGSNDEHWWNRDIDLEQLARKYLVTKSLDNGEYVISTPVQVQEKEEGAYFTWHEKLYLERADVENMINNGEVKVIYKNDKVLENCGDDFLTFMIYSWKLKQIYEIEKHTKNIRIDKEAAMNDYKDRLDALESFTNGAATGRFRTMQEEYIYNYNNLTAEQKSDYWSYDALRSLNESDYKSKLDAEPDFYEEEQYKEVYKGLVNLTFFPNGFVLYVGDKVAYILLYKAKQQEISVTMRADNPDSPMSGYLEEYYGYPAIYFGERNEEPEFIPAVNFVFSDESKRNMKLKQRDVFEQKPIGLSDEEWYYLIHKDNKSYEDLYKQKNITDDSEQVEDEKSSKIRVKDVIIYIIVFIVVSIFLTVIGGGLAVAAMIIYKKKKNKGSKKKDKK